MGTMLDMLTALTLFITVEAETAPARFLPSSPFCWEARMPIHGGRGTLVRGLTSGKSEHHSTLTTGERGRRQGLMPACLTSGADRTPS